MSTKKKAPEQGHKLPRFRVQFDINMKPQGDAPDAYNQKSLTVPDLNLTVRQMVDNYTRGIDQETTTNEPLYFDMDIPTFEDFADVYEYREFLEQQVEKADEFIKAQEDKTTEDVVEAVETPPLPFEPTDQEQSSSLE